MGWGWRLLCAVVCGSLCWAEYGEYEWGEEEEGEVVVRERGGGLVVVGTEGRAMEVPGPGSYITVTVGEEERRNLTMALLLVEGGRREVVFLYHRAQVPHPA